MQAAVRMLGEIGVEGGGALDVLAVVVNNLIEGLETPVVHVGRGEFDVAQAGGGEPAAVGFATGDFEAAGVGGSRGLDH